jgi:hypothetical protein
MVRCAGRTNVPARGVAAGVPGDLLARLAAQVVLKPVPFHGATWLTSPSMLVRDGTGKGWNIEV